MSSSFLSNDSSAKEGKNEFTPKHSIFPRLSQDEEMRIMEARIMELKRRKAMAQSSTTFDAFDQNGNERNYDGCSKSLEDDGQPNASNAILKRMDELETQRRQNEAVTTAKFEQQVKQLQNEQKTLLEKMDNIEKKQQKQEEKWTDALADQLKAFLDKKEQQQQKSDTLLGKISELEKQQQSFAQQMKTCSKTAVATPKLRPSHSAGHLQPFFSLFGCGEKIEANFGPNFTFDPANAKVFPEFRVKFNFWDANACHNDLAISGSNCTVVHHKGNNVNRKGSCNVFAKYSILDSFFVPSNIFYFELKIKNKKSLLYFGFAVKHQAPLSGGIGDRSGTFAYLCNCTFWLDRSQNGGNETFGTGDTVGCGVHLVNKQLFFTKNGHRIGIPNDFLISSLSADLLFPFVTLHCPCDNIEANFGPNFMFDLSSLC